MTLILILNKGDNMIDKDVMMMMMMMMIKVMIFVVVVMLVMIMIRAKKAIIMESFHT